MLNVSENEAKKVIRHNIYRARRKTFPALPKSLADVRTALEQISEMLVMIAEKVYCL